LVERQPSKLDVAGSSPVARSPSDDLAMLSSMRTAARIEARRLRSVEGRSVKDIAQAVGAPQSSVSLWVRDVALSVEQRDNLVCRARARRTRSRAAHYRERRLEYQADGRRRARNGEPLYVAGCMLYWAEGSKSKNAVQFVNSDPAMARYFVDFLRTYYDVRDDSFCISCNLFADHLEHQQEIELFWLDTLGLPATCLRKSTVNAYSKYSKKKRQGRLPYGTVRVCVHSTAIVQSIYGAIQEYGGFERPEWLD
jgi:hypothetical protein